MRFIVLFIFQVSFSQINIKSISLSDQFSFFDISDTQYQFVNTGGFQSLFAQIIDIDKDDKLEIFFTSLDIGILHVITQKSKNSLEFEIKTNYNFSEPVERWFQFIDLNNDQIYDLLTLDGFDIIGYKINIGSNLSPEFNEFIRLKDQNGNFIIPEFGNLPVVFDIDKDGKKDLFLSTQSQGNIIYYKNKSDNSPEFELITENYANVSVLGRSKKHGRSSFAFIDLDYDQDLDILWGDQFQQYFYFVENIGNDTNPEFQYDQNFDFTGGGSIISDFTYNLPVVSDFNHDGFTDILMLPQTDPLHNIQLYTSIGFNSEFKLESQDLIQSLDFGYNSSIKFVDLNDDLKSDIIISSSNFDTGFDLNFFIQDENGKYIETKFSSLTSFPWQMDKRDANDYEIADLNTDGLWDILFVDQNGDLYQSLNEGSNTSPIFSSYSKIKSLLGNFAQIRLVDIDSDSDLDLITTQIQGNFFLYLSENSLFDTKYNLAELSNRFDHLVSFDNIDSKNFLIYDDQNGTITQFSLTSPDSLIITDNRQLKLLYAGRNLNLSIHTNNSQKYFMSIGTNNGGVLFYEINLINGGIISSKNLTFYPNPSTTNINTHTDFLENEDIKKISIYSVTGKEINTANYNYFKTANSLEISFNDLPSGVYFVIINTNKKEYRGKFVHL